MKTNTVAYQSALPEAEKLALLKESKGGAWYDGWKPYCLMCNTMGRMTEMPYGHVCQGKGDYFGRKGCGNMVGWDGVRLEESPLNNKH